MHRLILLLITLLSFAKSYCQPLIDATSVLFNVEKQLNTLIITRSERLDSSAYTILVLKKCRSIKVKLNCLRGNLNNVSKEYLTSIDFNAKILSALEALPDSVIVPALTDIESDLSVKCDHQDFGLGIKNYYTDKVQFKVRTVKLVNTNGKTQDVKGYKVKANYWRYRNSPIPQYNFNDQITNPCLEVFLEPGEYDIWVEPVMQAVTKHTMSKKVINYKLTDKEITIIVAPN